MDHSKWTRRTLHLSLDNLKHSSPFHLHFRRPATRFHHDTSVISNETSFCLDIQYLSKLGLNRCRMDALVVEKLLDFLRYLHVLGQVATPVTQHAISQDNPALFVCIAIPDVSRGNDSIAGQLPNVELVDGQNAVHLTQQLPLNVVQLDVSWDGLEKNQG